MMEVVYYYEVIDTHKCSLLDDLYLDVKKIKYKSKEFFKEHHYTFDVMDGWYLSNGDSHDMIFCCPGCGKLL